MTLLKEAARLLARGCFFAFGRWEVVGKEGVPPRGRLLVVANHQANADPPVLLAALPRLPWFLAKEGLFINAPVAAVLRALGGHPLAEGGPDARALRWALRKLREDEVLVVFPEGTRNPGSMRRAQNGVAYLALRSQATILPVGITGTERIPGFWRVAFPFCHIKVNIGQPFSLPVMEGKLDDALLDSFTEFIMGRVAALLPPQYRGVYATIPSQPLPPSGRPS
ncbi:MAG: 1-acyl-sn-glycerol-3-phosphate acyltransferase [Chloroflexi bacterium]|nr:1-acyl-sn-glycerol-3-phosphate acyltransferase [Chloroflexota bacterium]